MSWLLGANCPGLRRFGVPNYKSSRAIPIRFGPWPSHQTANYWLASGSEDRTVRLWDASTGELRQTLRGHSDWVWSEANVELSILDKQWAFFRVKRVLWLPPDFRPICLAFRAGTLALGGSPGGVSFISGFVKFCLKRPKLSC